MIFINKTLLNPHCCNDGPDRYGLVKTDFVRQNITYNRNDTQAGNVVDHQPSEDLRYATGNTNYIIMIILYYTVAIEL